MWNIIGNVVIVYLIGCVIAYLILKYNESGKLAMDELVKPYEHILTREFITVVSSIVSWTVLYLVIMDWWDIWKHNLLNRKIRKAADKIEKMKEGKDEQTAKELQDIAEAMRDLANNK